MTVQYKYYICDVFTKKRFGGNPLAVLPEAEGLTYKNMQQIAREFNFSESAFVFPPENWNTRKVRIYTPAVEVPFAGHPNIGTAFVLASSGMIGDLTIKGVTKNTTLKGEYTGFIDAGKMGGKRIGYTAEAIINRQDFNINWNRNLDKGGPPNSLSSRQKNYLTITSYPYIV